MTEDRGIAIKDINGNYYCGLKKWDKQLRKAKLYHSVEYAIEAITLEHKEGKAYLVNVRIIAED